MGNRTASAPVSPATADSLPIDVLAKIFDYAPHAARLLAISPVCKRWRSAALRSIKSFRADIVKAQKMAAILALFPSLTDLTICRDISFFALPTTLQSLSLTKSYVIRTLQEEMGGGATFLSQRFPHLTALDTDDASGPTSSLKPADYAPFERFLGAHVLQLSSFKWRPSDHIPRGVAFSTWPALHTLEVRDTMLRHWSSPPPALTDLTLWSYNSDDLMAVAECWLTALTSIELFASAQSDATYGRLRRCPRLRSLSVCGCKDTALMARHADLFHRFASSVDVNSERDWEWLSRCKSAKWLAITAPFPSVPDAHYLPPLEAITLRRGYTNISTVEMLTYAMTVLSKFPSLTNLNVEVAGSDAAGEWQRLIEQAVVLGVSHRLTYIGLHWARNTRLGDFTPHLKRYGWLRIVNYWDED